MYTPELYSWKVFVWHRERWGSVAGMAICDKPHKRGARQGQSISAAQQNLFKSWQKVNKDMTIKAFGSSIHAPKCGTMVSTSVRAIGFGEADAHGLKTHSEILFLWIRGKKQGTDKWELGRSKNWCDILRNAECVNKFFFFLSSPSLFWVLWQLQWCGAIFEKDQPPAPHLHTHTHCSPCSSALMKWPHASSHPRAACTL